MIFRNVQNRCRHGVQAGGGLQLEAGELQHVQLTVAVEQHQRRQTNVAANANVNARRFRHLADQLGNGALAVRAGDRNHRCLGFAYEQFDIADNLHASFGGRAQRRVRQCETGAGNDQIGRQQPVVIQTTKVALNRLRQLIQPRR